MKRVLLTGGTGFVGAQIAHRLLNAGCTVHLLVRPGYARWRIATIADALHIHEVELTDSQVLEPVIAAIRPDWVFHLAAHGAYSWQTDAAQIVQTNLVSTVNLVNACLKVGFEAFIHAGSSSEYGYKDHAPDEQTWIDPNSDYAVMKAAATLYCRHAAIRHQARIVTLRLYSVYGPYEEPRRLIPTLIVKGLHGSLPPLVNPQVARDYVYVDDVYGAFIAAASVPEVPSGAVYNVGTGIQTSLREIVSVTQRLMPITDEPTWGSMPNRQWDTNTWVANNTRIKQELGWQPHYTLEDGLREFIAWFHRYPNLYQYYEAQIIG